MLDCDSASDEEADVCVAEWVDATNSKPFACSFLKPTWEEGRNEIYF
jgi:hypothetical protein